MNILVPKQSPKPTWVGASVLRLSVLLRRVTVPTWLRFFSLGHMSVLSDKVAEVEAEMKRIGYWSADAPPPIDNTKLYSGVSFEHWLQFVFLPAVRSASVSGDFSQVPSYRVGLSAMRQYDYHSVRPEAKQLMAYCWELEKLLVGKVSVLP